MREKQNSNPFEKLLSNCTVTIHQFNIGDGHQNFYQQKDGNGNLCYVLEAAEEVEAAETSAQTTPPDVICVDHIFNDGNKYINENLLRLRDDIGSCISGVRLKDESRYKLPRPQIDSSKKNQWYYIFKILKESGLLKPGVTDVRLIKQMIQWYPEVFGAFENKEQEKQIVDKMRKSITREKNYWIDENQEVSYGKMNDVWKKLNIDCDKKFLPMFSVCKELKLLLAAYLPKKE